MCCGHRKHQIDLRHSKHSSFCNCECGHSLRHYLSAKEKQENLEEYKDQLKKELAAVDEHLGEIRRT